MLELLLNVLPLILGSMVLYMSLRSFSRPRRRNDKTIIALGAISAFILIVMQITWLYVDVFSYRNDILDTFSSIWSIYNSLSMSILLLFISPREDYNKDKS